MITIINNLAEQKIIKSYNTSDIKCAICYNDIIKKRIILIKCGHACYCKECALKIKKCAICKSNIDYMVEFDL